MQRGLEQFPDEEKELEIMQQIYNDVNDLYQDEHLIMTQSDLLEQMYSKYSPSIFILLGILHEINMVARH